MQSGQVTEKVASGTLHRLMQSTCVCMCVYVCVSVNMSMCVCVYVCVYVRLYCRFRLKWTTRRYLLQNFSELRSNSKHFLVFTLHLYEAKRLFL